MDYLYSVWSVMEYGETKSDGVSHQMFVAQKKKQIAHRTAEQFNVFIE
ncbi:MAG: hypothetical protein L3J41_05110 [Melioribacteraceae bacterium]|nr:hypothetical protein [Melioribacteraceae bacterium]